MISLYYLSAQKVKSSSSRGLGWAVEKEERTVYQIFKDERACCSQQNPFLAPLLLYT